MLQADLLSEALQNRGIKTPAQIDMSSVKTPLVFQDDTVSSEVLEDVVTKLENEVLEEKLVSEDADNKAESESESESEDEDEDEDEDESEVEDEDEVEDESESEDESEDEDDTICVEGRPLTCWDMFCRRF